MLHLNLWPHNPCSEYMAVNNKVYRDSFSKLTPLDLLCSMKVLGLKLLLLRTWYVELGTLTPHTSNMCSEPRLILTKFVEQGPS
jgi:hypothetical protein